MTLSDSASAVQTTEWTPTTAMTPTQPSNGVIRLVPPIVLGMFAVTSLMRTGVDIVEIGRFGIYWGVAVLLPGLIVSRLLLGTQRTIVECLAVAGITGVSLEVLAWVLGVTVGLGSPVRFWWIPVLVAGAAVPSWRQQVWIRVPERVGTGNSVALSLLATFILARLDVFSFRSAPLPPRGGALFHDLWWQLSLVQETMRFERPQVPQVVGEPLNYHFLANVHIGIGSRLSGVRPEVVLLRLWLIPIVLVSIGLAMALGRVLTSSSTAGVVTAWLAFGVSVRTYIWVDVSGFAQNPIMFHSPSQLLANAGILAAALGFVRLFRRGASASLVGWLVLIVVVAGGSKSTVLPILIAATFTALIWAIVTRSTSVRPLLGATSGVLVLQGCVFVLASGTSGGKLVVLGMFKSLKVYQDLVPDEALRGVNDGLLLDSIDSPKHVAVAVLVTVVVLAMHTYRLAGLSMLARRTGRADVVNWWLSGAVVAGFAATLTIDHVGLSQSFFAITVVPLGAALTVAALWQFTRDEAQTRRSLVVSGLVSGSAITFVVSYFVAVRQRSGGYGALDRILFPMMLVVLLVVVAAWSWPRIQHPTGSVAGFLLAAIIGILIPAEVGLAAQTAYRWAHPVGDSPAVDAPNYVSFGELAAMIWLRDHSDQNDVILTNLHCRPVQPVPFCDAARLLGGWVVRATISVGRMGLHRRGAGPAGGGGQGLRPPAITVRRQSRAERCRVRQRRRGRPARALQALRPAVDRRGTSCGRGSASARIGGPGAVRQRRGHHPRDRDLIHDDDGSDAKDWMRAIEKSEPGTASSRRTPAEPVAMISDTNSRSLGPGPTTK